MKKATILNHIKMFLLAIYLLLTTIILILRITVLNRAFIEKQFNEEHYQKVERYLKETMKESMISSGIDDKVIDSMFTKEDIKDTTKQTLDIIYNYHKQSLNTTKIENNLRKNVEKNLKEKNYKVDNQKNFDTFINSIMKIYHSEFTMLNHLTKVGKYMNMIIKAFSVAAIILVSSFIILILLRKKTIKKLLPVPLFTTSFILLFVTWYINKTAGLSSITVFSKTFSEIIRKIIKNTFISIKILAIIYIIIAIILQLFFIHYHKRHRHHTHEEV